MRGRHLVRAATAGLGVVLLAGCGASPSATISTAISSPVPTASSRPQLKAMVLRETDFPVGWQGTPYQADPGAAADSAALVRCVGTRNTDGNVFAQAHSPSFALGNATVSASAFSFRSQRDVDSDVAMQHSAKLPRCYEQLLKKKVAGSLPAGVVFESASVKITHGSAGDPANVVGTLKGTIGIRANGRQSAMFVTIAFITGPLIEAEVDTVSGPKPLPEALVKSLVAMVAARATMG